MKHIKSILLLLLLSVNVNGQPLWSVTKVDPLINTIDNTLTLRLTAEITDIITEQGFLMVYHNSYMNGDTLVIRPYYFATPASSGFPRTVTKVNDLYIGNYIYHFKYICITPYDVIDVDTNTYPPTPNPPNYCLDMKTVSVPNTIADGNISIYPNPASTYINITGAVQSLAIYTINGQRVKDVSHPHRRISIAELPTGMYIIKLQTDDGILRRKLIVE